MSTSSNNYLMSFPYPPPTFMAGSTWNYNAAENNWRVSSQDVSPGSAQSTTVAQSSSVAPFPPLPFTADTSRPSVSAQPVDQVQTSLQTYNASKQPVYRPRRYSGTNAGQYGGTTRQYSHGTWQYSSNVQYSTSTLQYNSIVEQYSSNPQEYTRHYYTKRKPETDSDALRKNNKKKKKPLSQNIPQRKDWSVNDAIRALQVEKDYNKRHRRQSLIIKFPDLELNRDIVSKFHASIEGVHFQQPSTPRFCFVTLNDSADPETVIKALNKTKFGKGFLTAEFKKDRDDEINIGPEDIDPLTLYVGNLAQEVTKEGMITTYPKHKRIDIGYAKKMKYTRYAFVTFKNVNDSIEAFQRTHATQMYSKSIIVRFRRLNGTVGMPGEPKPQMPPQRNDIREPNRTGVDNPVDSVIHPTSDAEAEPCAVTSVSSPWESVDVSNWETDTDRSIEFIKQEPPEDSDDDDDEIEEKPPSKEFRSHFMPGSLEVAFSLHKPIVKTEIKRENTDEDNSVSSSVADKSDDLLPLPTTLHNNNNNRSLSAKETDVDSSQLNLISRNNSDADCLILPPDQLKKETEKFDSGTSYNSLRYLNRRARTMEFPRNEIKRETSTPTLDEASNDSRERVSSVCTDTDSTKIKSEPDNEDQLKKEIEKVDSGTSYNSLRYLNRRARTMEFPRNEIKGETSTPTLDEASNDSRERVSSVCTDTDSTKIKSEPDNEDDDAENSSTEESDDFNFNNILTSIEERSRRLMKLNKSML